MSVVVAGQVWKRPGVYATVTDLRVDPQAPDDAPARILATLVEIHLETTCVETRTISCDELRADHVLLFDATLTDPWAAAAPSVERRVREPEAVSPTEGMRSSVA